MLNKYLVFFLLSLIAYYCNVVLLNPFFTPFIFAIGLIYVFRSKLPISNLKLVMVTLFWSGFLYFIAGLATLFSIKDAFDGISVGPDDAGRLGLLIGLINGIGYALYSNLLLGHLRWKNYHWTTMIVAVLIGLLIGRELVMKSDNSILFFAHIIYFIGMAYVITRKRNEQLAILCIKNKK